MAADMPVPLPPSASVACHGQCRAVPEGGGGGLVVVVAPGGQGPVAIHRHWGGRWASLSAHSPRHSPQSGPVLRALRPRGSSGVAGGSRTRWSPITAGISSVCRKACTPSRASGTGRGGRGTGAAVSWASCLLFTSVVAQCTAWRVCGLLGLLTPVHLCARSLPCVACVRCPGPLGSCSPGCLLGVLCRMVVSRVHRCACLVCFVVCAVSSAI